jgi:hypothetical protein
MLRVLAWSAVVIALLLVPISRQLERQRERSTVARALRPPSRHLANEL